MTFDSDSETTRYIAPSAIMRWFVCALAAMAIALSSYLLVKSMTGGSLPGCGADTTFDCDSVLASRWSHVLGVPVSAPAIAMYLVVLIALQLSVGGTAARRRLAWMVLVVLASAILASAAWFVGVQVYLGSYCLYCMGAHALGVVLAVTLLSLAPKGPAKINPQDPDEPVDVMMIPLPFVAGLMVTGVIITGLLAGTQIIFKPAARVDIHLVQGKKDLDTGKDAGEARAMTILGGKVRLNPYDYPMMGSYEADHIIVYLFDYTCPNCRAMHHQFAKAVADLDGKLGIVKLAVPLDASCNPHVEKTSSMHQSACALAQLSTAVFLADQSKFHEYDVWLSAGANPPGVEEARDKAIELIGKPALEKQRASGEIERRIQSNITVYGMTGGSVVPQFIMGNTRIFSRPDAEQMMALFKEHLGIEPANAPAITPSQNQSPKQP